VFGSQIVDIRVCSACGAQGEPVPRESLLYRVYVSDINRLRAEHGRTISHACLVALLYPTQRRLCTGDIGLARLLKAEYATAELRCPAGRSCSGKQPKRSCAAVTLWLCFHKSFSSSLPATLSNPPPSSGAAHVRRWLLTIPQVFTMMLAWPPSPSREVMQALVDSIDQRLELAEVTHLPHCARMHSATDLQQNREFERA
jgi:hypothetical protein